MIIAVGKLVHVRCVGESDDMLCVVLSGGRPEFLGKVGGNKYYEVYCFQLQRAFLAFDYEMTPIGIDGSTPIISE